MGVLCRKKTLLYILDNITAKDIDNPEDFQFCETIYKKKEKMLLNYKVNKNSSASNICKNLVIYIERFVKKSFNSKYCKRNKFIS